MRQSLSIIRTRTDRVAAQEQKQKGKSRTADNESVQLIVQIPEGLYRAYQRGCWIVSQETGRSRDELAREMVTDFLVKYGC